MLFKKLLDKISKKSSNGPELDFECFENELNLAISILMIEVLDQMMNFLVKSEIKLFPC